MLRGDRQHIGAEVTRDLEEGIARLSLGLEILGVSLSEARPPAEVAADFSAAQAAESQRAIPVPTNCCPTTKNRRRGHSRESTLSHRHPFFSRAESGAESGTRSGKRDRAESGTGPLLAILASRGVT